MLIGSSLEVSTHHNSNNDENNNIKYASDNSLSLKNTFMHTHTLFVHSITPGYVTQFYSQSNMLLGQQLIVKK